MQEVKDVAQSVEARGVKRGGRTRLSYSRLSVRGPMGLSSEADGGIRFVNGLTFPVRPGREAFRVYLDAIRLRCEK